MAHRRTLNDVYAVLEVNPRACDEVIRAAGKALLVKYHPDRNGGDDRRSKQISEALSILTDPKERARLESSNVEEGKIVGEYRVLSLIAEGGFGHTYKAEHLLVGELVCIKHCSRISSLDEQILLDEARAMWNLRHYSVPSVRNILQLPDRSLALVMSFIPGPTLAEIVEGLIEKRARLDPEHVAWITERVLNALRYIHYQGIVHGDLKPHNVIVEPDKHLASIVDFGLSKIRPKEGSGNKGYTALFSAPEVVDGGTNVPESDFYSLGMTMIYALSGDAGHLERREIPRNTPKPMKEFIARLIVRDPLSRPHWPEKPNTRDLWDEFLDVRHQAFGRNRSGLKPIPGF